MCIYNEPGTDYTVANKHGLCLVEDDLPQTF